MNLQVHPVPSLQGLQDGFAGLWVDARAVDGHDPGGLL